MIKILLLLIFMSSCLFQEPREKTHDLFWAQVKQEFLLAQEVTLSFDFKRQKVVHLSDPPNVWKLVMATKNHCLWYRTPSEVMEGELKLLAGNHCQADFNVSSLVELKGIKDLLLFEDYTFSFNYEYEGEKKTTIVNLPNLSQLKTVDERSFSLIDKKDRFASSTPTRQKKTLKAWSELPKTDQDLWGTRNDSYLDKTAIRCHQVDDQCQDIRPNECGRCKYGWYEVVDHRCPQGGSKFCGRDLCGQRGQPACPRGLGHLGEDLSVLCFADSPAGFCADGLNTHCDENQILICL